MSLFKKSQLNDFIYVHKKCLIIYFCLIYGRFFLIEYGHAN